MPREASSQAVQIFGETYWLKSDQAPERLEALAFEVDRRMRELAEAQPGIGTGRLALLAALHLAEELSRVREDHTRDREEMEQRLEAWIARLEAALGSSVAASSQGGGNREA